MTLHPFELESVNASIRQNHRDALHALQVRSALAAQPASSNIVESVLSSLGSAMASIRMINRPATDTTRGPVPCAC